MDSHRTKDVFADAIIQLAKTKEISRIKVKDLCTFCGYNRQSFYYHFKDKYELLAYIFINDYQYAFSCSEVQNSETMMRIALQKMNEKKTFYKNVMQDTSQNNMNDYTLKMFVEMEERIIKDYLNTDYLEKSLLFAIKGYSYACLGHVKEWFLGTSTFTIDELAHEMYNSMPALLKQAYQNLDKI
ncbi:MAG: TetR/AcrR family transcriptional regulator C-terminal domain-containing protein [Oscillospiraceae bacterium]|nr:TetR/AcrR family transcriptional regulator C-terminal domain-containing protein [Oscillospiraceae bacterium]